MHSDSFVVTATFAHEPPRPTCAGAARKTPSPGSSAPNTDHNNRQPAPLVGADEALAPKARRLVQTRRKYREKSSPAFAGGLFADLQGRRDSNPQPPVLETGALPVELRP